LGHLSLIVKKVVFLPKKTNLRRIFTVVRTRQGRDCRPVFFLNSKKAWVDTPLVARLFCIFVPLPKFFKELKPYKICAP